MKTFGDCVKHLGNYPSTLKDCGSSKLNKMHYHFRVGFLPVFIILKPFLMVSLGDFRILCRGLLISTNVFSNALK